MKYIYHSQEIKAVVPITDVLAMYGLRNDTTRMIPCPDIKHDDSHPSAKIYPQSNTCHCFSCNTNLNPIDIVMQQEGASFPQACEILIERFGLDKDWYAEKVSSGNEEYHEEEKEIFPLSPKELKLLGFSMCIDLKDPYMDEDGRMQVRHIPYSMTTFWKENPEGFDYIIAGKVQEKLEDKLDENDRRLEYIAGFPYDMEEKFEDNDELCLCGEELYKDYKENGVIPPRFSRNHDILFAYTTYKAALDDYYRVEAEIKTLECIAERFPRELTLDILEENELDTFAQLEDK